MDHYDIEETEGDEYTLDHWLADMFYMQCESNMAYWQQEYQEYQQYGAIWEEADRLAELEAAEEALIEEDSRKDAMYRLEQTIEGAKEFGCEMDKSFAYEGLDILNQENVDKHCGHGDPSQWTY